MINTLSQITPRRGSSANKSVLPLSLIVITLALPLLAQAANPRYQLITLQSLGEPAYYEYFWGPTSRLLNNNGIVVGARDTSFPDPLCMSPTCLTYHALTWTNGSPTDLGTLEINVQVGTSQALWINDQGRIIGESTYNTSPSSDKALFKGVMWIEGIITELGTLGGDQSFAQAINNRNQVVGSALNTLPASKNIWEDFPWPFATQQRAVLWENGVPLDLGTLGGPSAWATGINDNGQIIGQSYTAVATGVPRHVDEWAFSRPMAGFIWENGKMTDLGNLGGTWALPRRINNQGQVIGNMTLNGDTSFHPFLWEKGVLKDLGTFGGNIGRANDINEAGDVVGGAAGPSGFRAFLWRNGVKTDLGTLDNNSQAWFINAKGQIVGASGIQPNTRAFLWENGGPMLDLNKLVPAGSPKLTEALALNDRGEIICGGLNERGLYLLVPAPRLAVHAAAGTSLLEMKVLPGRSYSLETSTNLQTWIPLGPSFTADAETVTRSFESNESSRYYRVILLP